MNSICFTANFKTNATIQTRSGYNFSNQRASIVELDRNSAQDLSSLYKLSLLWDKESKNNVSYIFSDFINDINESNGVKDTHCVVLTLQKDNFEKLKHDKILGVALFSEQDYDNEINWLQVEPKNNKTDNPSGRKYKNIGSTLCQYFKCTYTDKPIYVRSANDATNFYISNGFKPYDVNYPQYLYYVA